MAAQNVPVLVIGGGVAGLSAAIGLGRRNIDCLLIEKGPALGGMVKGFCCKALDTCVHCGACRLGDLLAQAQARPQVEILTLAAPVSARRNGLGWQVEIEPQPGLGEPPPLLGSPLQKPLTLEAQAVILAVGYTPFDPSQKTRFGYGRVPGVISALELEAMLGQEVLAAPDGQVPQRMAFIQCVGSRDQSLGNLYCSRVCCGYALDMARLIRSRWPQTEISFFHMDVQGYGPSFEQALVQMRGEFNFVRAMPGEVVKGEKGAGVVFAGKGDQPVQEEFELVVLSVGLTPPPAAGELGRMFGLSRSQDGFLEPAKARDGVFIAGAAQGPRGIVESIDHAALAASAALEHLSRDDRKAAHA
ncbi:MAG: FAD-dependent oxidoreductase [Desulfarculaceae bacterium]